MILYNISYNIEFSGEYIKRELKKFSYSLKITSMIGKIY